LDASFVVHEMVSCYHDVVSKQRYFDGETRGWGGLSLVTLWNFAGRRMVRRHKGDHGGCLGQNLSS
jgi:hypothetical protein